MREDDHDIEPPIDQLCERIVARHHAYLRRTLPIVVADLARLGDGDGDGAAGPLAETRAAAADLVQQLKGHLSKEENVLFPALVALAVSSAGRQVADERVAFEHVGAARVVDDQRPRS